MGWRDDAKCKGIDPAIFFPDDRGHREAENVTAAKAICAVCPVRRPCRKEGRANQELGIWGGETEAERFERRRPSLYGQCVMCGSTFEHERRPGPRSVTCGPLCSWDRVMQQDREYRERRLAESGPGVNRVTGLQGDTRAREHGTLKTYRSGCRCGACANASSFHRRRTRFMQQIERAERAS